MIQFVRLDKDETIATWKSSAFGSTKSGELLVAQRHKDEIELMVAGVLVIQGTSDLLRLYCLHSHGIADPDYQSGASCSGVVGRVPSFDECPALTHLHHCKDSDSIIMILIQLQYAGVAPVATGEPSERRTRRTRHHATRATVLKQRSSTTSHAML